MISKAFALLSAVLLCLLMGCSATPGTPSRDTTPAASLTVSEDQKNALSDGVVTHDEYEAGYRRYVVCLSAAGFSVIDSGEKNQVHEFGVPADAISSGDDDRCYTHEFKNLDVEWQISRENTSQNAKIMHDCLVRRGIVPKSTVAEMSQQLEENNLSFDQCVTEQQ